MNTRPESPTTTTATSTTATDTAARRATWQGTPVTKPGGVGRRLAAVALIGGAALNTTEAVLAQLLPERPATTAEALRLVAENSALYGTRAVLGTLAIPLMAIAFLALAQLLATRARRLAGIAGGALLAGMWGFVGIHILGLVQLPASQLDPAQAAPVLDAIEGHPVLGLLFLLPFLAGCALGMVLLAVGVLWTRVLPRWVGIAWLVFILVDFTVGAVGPVDPHWLFLAGSIGAAVAILRSPRTAAATVAA
ncbi:hypothetical protein [Naasia sp. SYSU D00948]|uniref:hypothetical protein n=1 Tax=Naasia sp. SYSU D00948 TaxID=2817379 RepID=UPI001B317D88|nr:hypothetical protein [Naasia sp. SYSU D00948]